MRSLLSSVISFACPSLENGFCAIKQSMHVMNISVHSAINVVSCKNKCFEMYNRHVTPDGQCFSPS
jgi:hypothetical protein